MNMNNSFPCLVSIIITNAKPIITKSFQEVVLSIWWQKQQEIFKTFSHLSSGILKMLWVRGLDFHKNNFLYIKFFCYDSCLHMYSARVQRVKFVLNIVKQGSVWSH